VGLSPASVAILGAHAVGGVLGLAFALVAKNRQETPAADAYKRFVFAIGLWSFAYAGVLASPSLELAIAFDVLVSVFSTLAAFFWLFFAVEYTGHGEWLTRRRTALLLAEPAAFVLVYATNSVHGLAYATPELVSMGSLSVLTKTDSVLVEAQIGVIYLVNIAGFALLIRFLLRTRNIYRKQTLAIIVGPLILFTGNAMFVAGLRLHGAYDPTPVSFVLTAVFMGVALLRYDFLNVTPLAADMLIDEMNDPIVVLGEERVIDYNPAARRLFDGQRATDEPVDGVLPGLRAVLESAPRTDSAGTTGDDRSPPPGDRDTDPDVYHASVEGRDRVFDPEVTPIRDQHGIRRGRLVVLRDVTSRKRRETELQRKNERLEQFVGVVSHDLRNPLNVARGYVELADERTDDDALEQADERTDDDALEQADEALVRTQEMVEELLELARQGRTVDDPESIRVGEAARLAWAHVDTAGATLAVDADLVVRADPTRLQEAFENLFRNAVEHGSTGSRTSSDVTVRVGADADSFWVEDDGPGFDADEVDVVFQSGYTTAENGTGFGLDIVENIVEAHGWQIEATDGTDGGARFEVTIDPATRADTGDTDPGASAVTGGGRDYGRPT